jgi:hypothetical protein
MNLRFLLAGLCLCAAPSAALALNGPSVITIDGGPLGQLSLSGGADGGFYTQTNASAGTKNAGAALGNVLTELQKTSSIVQFTIEVGAYSAQVLGTAPVTDNYFSTSPLYAGYITIAPNSVASVSAGQLSPLVGYEASQDWGNASQFFSVIAATQPGQGRGAEVALTEGAFSATISLTDGYYTGVVNYIQGIGTWAPNSDDSVSVYGGGNLVRTGLNVQGTGNALLNNSTMLGVFYTGTLGALTLTPEMQVQYANGSKPLGLGGYVRSFSTALFADYRFVTTQFSLGGFVEYAAEGYDKGASFTTTPDFFGTGPGSTLYGLSIAPTWQKGDLFARADLGALHAHVTAGGTKPVELQASLEAGLLF